MTIRTKINKLFRKAKALAFRLKQSRPLLQSLVLMLRSAGSTLWSPARTGVGLGGAASITI
ncbi:hypothetical protein [Pedobacter psychrodurus]|uniref:hypothetical protein n=1 Tax=Pedobacter psychrodurus TaxID=2530456 RepID=UPI00293135E6|nr:hypothetical protein [Pedobacter psychrodurus]